MHTHRHTGTNTHIIVCYAYPVAGVLKSLPQKDLQVEEDTSAVCTFTAVAAHTFTAVAAYTFTAVAAHTFTAVGAVVVVVVVVQDLHHFIVGEKVTK